MQTAAPEESGRRFFIVGGKGRGRSERFDGVAVVLEVLTPRIDAIGQREVVCLARRLIGQFQLGEGTVHASLELLEFRPVQEGFGLMPAAATGLGRQIPHLGIIGMSAAHVFQLLACAGGVLLQPDLGKCQACRQVIRLQAQQASGALRGLVIATCIPGDLDGTGADQG